MTHRLFRQPWPEGEYRLFQLGFVVDDLYGAASRWAEVHGVGPFHALRRTETRSTYRGRPTALDLQVAVAQAGPVQVELIQVFSTGESVYRDFAEVRAGFHQICTLTYDYDVTVAHYQGLGYELASELLDRQRVAFFDTMSDFGFYTEVAEATPAFVDALTTISKTCSEWDGTDPVRILTRDGYRVP